MIADLGHWLLILATLCTLWQAGFIFYRSHMFYARLMPALTLVSCALQCGAFLLLIIAFAISDFSVSLVFEHSHTLKPMLYKITGAWGNHEGSILLWCVILSCCGALMAINRHYHRPTICVALHVLGGLNCIFLIYTIFTSSPFIVLAPTPAQGQGLNPLLQDIGLAFHPPMLYIGYVGCAALFALAAAACVSGHHGIPLAKMLRGWILLPWSALTFGIGLGSWWAYRELGWGGFWFWDPVENASLLPWLLLTALLHANIAARKFGHLQGWQLGLAFGCFLFSLLGTFLIRSGLLTSVHSFATDPTRGVALLAITAGVCCAALYLFRRAYDALPTGTPHHLLTRDTALLINVTSFTALSCAIVGGMFAPLLLEITHGRILTIGTGYYNQMTQWLLLPALAVCTLGHMAIWRNAPPRAAKRRGARLLFASLAVGILSAWWIGLTAWPLIISHVIGIWLLITVLSLCLRPNRKAIIGALLGHLAAGIVVLSITYYAAFHERYEFVMHANAPQKAGQFTLSINTPDYGTASNYFYQSSIVTITSSDGITRLQPEERFYPAEDQHTTEADITSTIKHDLYATIRSAPDIENSQNNEKPPLILQFYVNPAMLWLWIGIALAGLSGLYLFITHRNARHI